MFHCIKIADMVCPCNVFLAPMAGYTNYPFRKICAKLGAGLTFTEMVSCKGLLYNSEETKKLLYCGDEPFKAVQIFGNDPEIMRRACESEDLSPFDLVDINMGCPMPKIVRNGEGSALLDDPRLAEKIVLSCAKSGKPVSVKIRIGTSPERLVGAEFAKMLESAGACMITVHGRTRDKIYAGEPDFREMEKIKSAVKIPVIANGGVWSKKDGVKLLERTGADGLMIARAALYRPQVFCEFTGKEPPPVSAFFYEQLAETEALFGERFATVFMRKMAAFYLKGTRCAAEYKRRLFAVQSTDELKTLAEEIF